MVNGATDFISIMGTLVSNMTPIITIDSNDVEGSNYRLTMCRTYWVMVDMKIIIGGITFTVIEIDQDVSILVKGPAQPIGTTFQLDAPEFWYSTHRKVNSERKNQTDIRLPFVYLPIYEVVEDHDDETDISYVADIRPLFLAGYNIQKDTIVLQQSETIKPMNAMATLFEEMVDDLDQQFNEPDSITRKEWMNFGSSTVWGNDTLIFDQPISGVELRMALQVLNENLCLCDGAPFKVCTDVTILVNGVFNQFKEAGETYNCVTTGGGPASVDLNGSSLIDIPGSQTKTITIEFENGDPLTITPVINTANVFDGTVPDLIAAVNTSNLFQDGQITSYATGDLPGWYRGVDHGTLSHNNPYGDTERFRDTAGGAIYANDIVVDWSTEDRIGEVVLGFYRITATSISWANAMSLANASVQAGFSNWAIPSRKETINLYNEEVSGGSPIGLNFSPMNIIVSASSERLWTRTTGGIVTRAYCAIENGSFQGLNKTTTTNDFFLVRQFTYAELGL